MASRSFLVPCVLVAVLVAGCDAKAPGDIGNLQRLAEQCPNGPFSEYIAYDVSGSSNDAVIKAARGKVIEDLVDRVAACQGDLRVSAFTGSSVASQVVFDDHLGQDGATQIARLRKMPPVIQTTLQKIESGLADAAAKLPQNGSDITSQFVQANEYGQQKLAENKDSDLDVEILSDGFSNAGVVLPANLTVASATEIAQKAPTIKMPPRTSVRISGIGKTSDAPAPTSQVEALKAYYEAYCGRTGAASCTAVTDYTD